jgi:starch-binding outer membrane protein, SusD/RagB family
MSIMSKNLFSKYIAAGLLIPTAIILFSSCKKYLTVEPVSSFGTGYVFSNTTNADLAVLGAYAALGGDQGYGIRVSMYYPYDNDEMMGQGGNPGDNERRDIARYNTKPSNTQLANPFNQMYSGIERANICIYNIPQMMQYSNGTDTEKKKLRHLHGEALTLRAQFYMELIRNWGDVPAQFLPSSLETDLFKTKTNRDSIYDQILADLATASSLVPWRTETNVSNERITQGAVRGLRARIALYRGGYSLRKNRKMERSADYKTFYQIAKDECAAIMQRTGDHKLNPSFLSVFKDAIGAHKQEPNGEIIWEVGMTGGGSGFGDSKLGYYNGPRYNGTGNGALIILPTFFYSFHPQDTRRDVTCAPYDITKEFYKVPRTLQSMTDGKFRRDWTSQLTSAAQYFGTNWPMIRLSDVLLMFAEADNELNNGPTPAAIAALEQVRLRAFGGDVSLIGTTPADYAGFFSAVMKERMLELGGEGIRKYDLLRWNKLEQRLKEVKTEMGFMVARQVPYDNLPTTMYYLPNSTTLVWGNSFYEPTPATAPVGYSSVSWVGNNITTTLINIIAVSFTPNKSELLPLPQASLDANPNLVQDYGH